MLHLLRAFGFSVGSALAAMVIYPLITSMIKGNKDDKLKEQMKQAYAEDSLKFEEMVTKAKTE